LKYVIIKKSVKIIIYGKNLDLTPSIRTFAERKVGSISKFLKPTESNLAEARVEIGRPSRHHRSGLVYYGEINLKIGGRLFRAVAEHLDLRVAIDLVRDEIERQIKGYKGKNRQVRRVPKNLESGI
jgi:putative sigma-54 modulation protein